MKPVVHWVIYGQTTLPQSMVMPNGAKEIRYPIVLGLYHIQIGERQILIDAGCDTMPGFEVTNFISPADALGKIGVRPEQITDIIITHAHHDHIEGVHHFPNATIYIQEEEYEMGKKHIPARNPVYTFQDHCVVAGCIRVERIGGHSCGSCIAKMEMGEKQFVFAGDECYLQMCLDKKIPTGTSFCPEKSKIFIDTYSNPAYSVLLSHDPGRKEGRVK